MSRRAGDAVGDSSPPDDGEPVPDQVEPDDIDALDGVDELDGVDLSDLDAELLELDDAADAPADIVDMIDFDDPSGGFEPGSDAALAAEYLDALQRVKAEFANYKRRIEKMGREDADRASGQVVAELLPVLDACDAAVAHGAEDVEPIAAALYDALGKAGLERMDAAGAPFDPNLHEAVMHEEADADDDGPTVSGELRAGYLWKGRVLRAAMVQVKG